MARITVDFERPITNAVGDVVGNETQGRVLALVLSEANVEAHIVKFWDWAKTLGKRLPLEIDNEDFENLKEWIRLSKQMPLMTKANLIGTMLEAKAAFEAAEKAKA